MTPEQEAALAAAQARLAGKGAGAAPQVTFSPEHQAILDAAQQRLAETPGPSQNTWPQVAKSAARNVAPDAGRVGAGFVEAAKHPVDTFRGLGELATGAAQNAGDRGAIPRSGALPPQNPRFAFPRVDTSVADAVGNDYRGKYGSVGAIKATLSTQPVSAALDASTVLTGAGGAAAKAPGTLGKIGSAVRTAGSFTDPLVGTLKAVGKAGEAIGSAGLGLATGAGMTPFRTAARVGFSGTDQAREALTAGMRDPAARGDALVKAKAAVQAMKRERGQAYETEMGKISGDTTQLDFTPINEAWGKLVDTLQTKRGNVLVGDAEAAKVQEIGTVLAQWEADTAEHTVAGLDGLKKRIQAIYTDNPNQKQAGRSVTTMVDAVKRVIEDQAPEYAAIMKRYEEESSLIGEIESALSLGNSKSADTAMRKLDSVMRNNVNTNYGNRLELVKQLEQHGGQEIQPSIAGGALSSPTPRGLAQNNAALPLAGAGMQMFNGHPLQAAMAAAGVGLTSPRLMGEAVYGASRAVGKAAELAKAMGVTPAGARATELGLFQTGNAEQDLRLRALAQALR